MTLTIFLSHFVLAIILFFITNWIGRHSYSLGYMEVTLFVQNEDSPAINFLIRVATPVVYLIIVSTLIYLLNINVLIYNIYLINVYYLFFRLIVSLIIGRGALINWYRLVSYWITILACSYIVYDKIIKVKINILPDFSNIANELWMIILVFIFQLFNNIKVSEAHSIKRKDNYIDKQYNLFKRKYGTIIKKNTKNDILEAVAYAILIYENFNRHAIIRGIEKLSFKITGKPHTLGVMQVLSHKNITNEESVEIGSKKIYAAYLEFKKNYKKDPDGYYGVWSAYDEIIADYNGGSSYSAEVSSLTSTILNKFYKSTKDTLFTPKP